MRNPVRVKVSREIVKSGGIKGLKPAVRDGALDGLNAVGTAMLSSAKRRIQSGGRSGRTYQKYGPRRTHTASAPGEAPKTDTGALVNSGFYKVDEAEVEVRVGFDKFYAAFLEYGTRLMAKRPFLLPTVEEWRGKIARVIKNAIKARLK